MIKKNRSRNNFRSKIDGFNIFSLKFHKDNRGLFFETFRKSDFTKNKYNFIQDNISRSKKNVLRGMHYQLKNPQAQIVTIFHGKIFDVVVDLREKSKTFGCWSSAILSSTGKYNQAYMEPGLAHGFLVLSDYADLHYKVTNYYDVQNEYGLIWSDENISIKWPIKKPILSKKDKTHPSFDNLIKKSLPRIKS